ncbi:hypothetical protein EJ04DRAFT_559663 [Polyplosphaeria fusca]|uniref:Uncharacterized protein n=1 Tax=Polyplosphaeria fusca TaxID=682080 RepID=A0A9P4RAH0_9PLEO|nr:hypothetical protein EJ04DRAFT_559663 [Polyplosphaeria fusca]
MSSGMSSLTLAGLLALGARTVLAQSCYSYGIDFQSGGYYFQNINSQENFTLVEQFDGCNNDFAYNVLVDPDNNQILCSNTYLTPPNTNQLSSCPILKSQLSSGPWSILVLSNNTGGEPIAYERDFTLSVGVQSTSTFTPTLTNTLVTTPVVSITSTQIDTQYTTLPPSTVTSASTTVTPTVTKTPATVTTTTTKALLTITWTSYAVKVSQVTKTKTASCKTPTRQATHDPTCTVRPTVIPGLNRIFGARAKRELDEINAMNAEWHEKRVARYQARAPDPQPLIVTQTDTNLWTTATVTSTADATTATIVTTGSTTSTVTPAPITVLRGTKTAPVVTTTAPTPTRTITRYNVATSVVTWSRQWIYTITTTAYPSASASACKTAGGVFF